MHVTCVFADSHTRWEDHGLMTKEQAVYADTLNLLGSDILDPVRDFTLVDTLAASRRRAALPTGPHADCPSEGCHWTTPYGGVTDGEHFADLWEHMIVHHRVDVRQAEDYVSRAWRYAGAAYPEAVAA